MLDVFPSSFFQMIVHNSKRHSQMSLLHEVHLIRYMFTDRWLTMNTT